MGQPWRSISRHQPKLTPAPTSNRDQVIQAHLRLLQRSSFEPVTFDTIHTPKGSDHGILFGRPDASRRQDAKGTNSSITQAHRATVHITTHIPVDCLTSERYNGRVSKHCRGRDAHARATVALQPTQAVIMTHAPRRCAPTKLPLPMLILARKCMPRLLSQESRPGWPFGATPLARKGQERGTAQNPTRPHLPSNPRGGKGGVSLLAPDERGGTPRRSKREHHLLLFA